MSMFFLAFVISLLVAISFASPVGRKTSVCPWNGVSTVQNFTLLAVVKDYPNIQKSLVLGSHDSSTPGCVTWLEARESVDSINAKFFTLVNGGITAYAPDGSLIGVSLPVPNMNGKLSFLYPKSGENASPAEVYCELFNTSPHGVPFPYALAVNDGDSDHFSLCKSNSAEASVVLYNIVKASAADIRSKWGTCADVYIHVLPIVQ
ncbi:hypothetical protein B0F90DRAFT_965003 [Multifurca ochricompacta]|uniref:Uncharacterized protein n=1 Tax=Multifurca ochricompacta TaxID=376703 RepID=A0AAD4M962_9AGAM|nr:hypothetical protein B0F90DRAFT_965003 [Multifurca ochricompacta]